MSKPERIERTDLLVLENLQLKRALLETQFNSIVREQQIAEKDLFARYEIDPAADRVDFGSGVITRPVAVEPEKTLEKSE